MPPKAKLDPNLPWTTRLLVYAFDQGPMAVILGAILAFMFIQGPKHVESIKAGYREQTATHEKMQADQRTDFKEMLKDQREIHGAAIKLLADSVSKQTDGVEKQTQVLERLIEEVQRDRKKNCGEQERPSAPSPCGPSPRSPSTSSSSTTFTTSAAGWCSTRPSSGGGTASGSRSSPGGW